MSNPTLEAARTDTGWLAAHRWQVALGIAIAETLVAAFQGVSRWVVIAVGVLALLAYGRYASRVRSGLGRELAWIAAVSQALAILVAVAAFFIGVFVLLIAGLLAVGGLVLLFLERPPR